MQITGIKTPIITAGDDLVDTFLRSLSRILSEKSIVLITSKVVSVSEGSVFPCNTKDDLQRIIFKEADEVLGKSEKYDFWLTRKNGFLLPNSGIDQSNAKKGTVLLLPKNAQKSADDFRGRLQKKTGRKDLGIIICDSRILPFRRGISGVALAWSGFAGVSDERGKADLFGRKLLVSEMAVADNFSSIAQIFFGQSNESIPFVLAENATVAFTNEQQNYLYACIPTDEDLFAEVFKGKE